MSELDLKALFKVEYGLFVITTNDGNKDNGFISNSCLQVSSNPTFMAVSINKNNYSHDTVMKTRKLNVCPITEEADFSIFERFGFHSGRDTDKFEGMSCPRADNGLLYLDKLSNACLSLEVSQTIDFPSHTLFICELVGAKILSSAPSMTYGYYHKNVKPKPQAQKKEDKKPGLRRWECQICGYIYEGEELPEDFVCPLCNHPASDFVEIFD